MLGVHSSQWLRKRSFAAFSFNLAEPADIAGDVPKLSRLPEPYASLQSQPALEHVTISPANRLDTVYVYQATNAKRCTVSRPQNRPRRQLDLAVVRSALSAIFAPIAFTLLSLPTALP